MSRRVVVTGVGAITPLGVGADALFERWSAGECGIADGLGRCSEFNPAVHLGSKSRDDSDRFAQLALVAADEAIEQAGWSDSLPVPAERIGCVIGTGLGGGGTMANAASVAVAMRHGIRGECLGAVSDCAGAHAIGAGLRMVQHGDADACVVGGAEAALTGGTEAALLGGLGHPERLGTSPTGIPRPFDAHSDGFVVGEGAGILVLEAESVARARGARPLATLVGYGATAHLHVADQSSVEGEAGAIRVALADADREPGEVDYVNAHGAATLADDRCETEALKDVLGCHARWIPVSSPKSAIGHLLGAAGAVEAVATILALVRRTAPPTVGLDVPGEGLDLDYVPGVAHAIDAQGRPLLAISNSFGFGGDNAVLCVEAAA